MARSEKDTQPYTVIAVPSKYDLMVSLLDASPTADARTARFGISRVVDGHAYVGHVDAVIESVARGASLVVDALSVTGHVPATGPGKEPARFKATLHMTHVASYESTFEYV